ncbi:hypothetical protein N431DRAFT_481528 [Stipitochalara longipes BDJ]|nr:hypothetical protein N431DRAFT_481528 [Stipitochalara longipes BDJ]
MSASNGSRPPSRPLSPLPGSPKYDTIFEEARASFLDLIPENERLAISDCHDAATLIAHIKTLVSQTPALAQPHQWLSKITKFTKRMEQYFEIYDIINIMVSPNQRYAAVTWGAVRFILKLCSNYATFFEKVVTFLDHIGLAFREYEYLCKVFKHEDNEKEARRARAAFKDFQKSGLVEFETAICNFYTDLFEFFRRIVHIFRKRDGKPTTRPMVMGKLAWKPFDVRFSDILASFDRHRSIIAMALHLQEKWKKSEDRVESHMERVTAEQHRTESTIDRIYTWLDSFRYYEKLDQVRCARMPNTSEWLLTESKYRNWLEEGSDDLSKRLLWVNGNPGCGKTFLAASAVENLRAWQSGSEQAEGLRCYYFFDQIDQKWSTHNSPTDAYRAILSQVLQQRRSDQSILDQFTFFMASPDTSRTATHTDLLALLLLCFNQAEPSSLVLDGFDECNDQPGLFQCVQDLSSKTRCKILLFSRPNVAVLRRSIGKENSIRVSSRRMEQDIRTYFTHYLDPLYEDRKLPPTCDLAAITKHLVRVCDGMFLWARLALIYLTSEALTPSERLEAIWQVQLPEGLDVIYARILGLLEKAPSSAKLLAPRVFMWLIYAREPLSTLQLHDVLSVSAFTHYQSEEPMINESAIILSCVGLVHISTDSYQLIHLSLKEFLQSNNQTAIDFVKSFEQSTLDIAIACMRYLAIKVPERPLSGQLGLESSPVEVDNKFPFLRYAAKHWPLHTYEATVSHAPHIEQVDTTVLNGLVSLIDRFLKSKLQIMTWIQSVYIFRSSEICFEQLRSWAIYASKIITIKRIAEPDLIHVANETLALCKDLGVLQAEWHPTLKRRPGEIWGDVTSFTKSRFLQSTKATEVTSLATVSPLPDSICGVPLGQDTQVSLSGTEYAVLSIWPSQKFELAKEKFGSKVLDKLLREISSGWIATYEIWSIKGDLRRLCRKTVPLDYNEILSQMQCTLNRGFWGSSWKFEFPTTISADLRTFCVLRTIYVFRKTDSDSSSRLVPLVLPLDFRYELNLRWPRPGARAYRQHVQSGRSQQQEYTVRICSTSRYICFRNYSIVAVFELSHDTHPRISLLSHIPDGIVHDVFCLHGTLPLLAFAESSSIKIWDFKTQEGPLVQTIKRDQDQDMGLRIKNLSFSQTEDNLEFTLFDDAFPNVISLRSHATFQAEMNRVSANAKDKGKGKYNKISTLDVSDDETSMISNNVGVLTETSATNPSARIVHDEDSIVLDLKSPLGVTTEMQLLSLPQWQHLSEAGATVVCPRTKEEKINVILSAPSHPLFEVSDTIRREKAYLPLHVQKDQRAVRKMRDERIKEMIEGSYNNRLRIQGADNG